VSILFSNGECAFLQVWISMTTETTMTYAFQLSQLKNIWQHRGWKNS